jgi:hypothetical protein
VRQHSTLVKLAIEIIITDGWTSYDSINEELSYLADGEVTTGDDELDVFLVTHGEHFCQI